MIFNDKQNSTTKQELLFDLRTESGR